MYLFETVQGHQSVAEFTVDFCTATADSGWNLTADGWNLTAPYNAFSLLTSRMSSILMNCQLSWMTLFPRPPGRVERTSNDAPGNLAPHLQLLQHLLLQPLHQVLGHLPSPWWSPKAVILH